MKKKLSLPILLGVALIAVGLGLLAVRQVQMHRASKTAQSIAAKLQEIMPPVTPGMTGIYDDPAMPVLQVEGIDCVAMLEIPDLSVCLPVADMWDADTLPSRFSGSAYDGSLVIGGADYPGQFDFCARIENGTGVTVTDMTGAQFTYTVSRVDRSQHAQAAWLQKPEFALTLFCRDAQTLEYIAVRCIP